MSMSFTDPRFVVVAGALVAGGSFISLPEASADVEFQGLKDATIWSVNPDDNYDGNPIGGNESDRMTIEQGHGGEEDMHAYLAFDISSLTQSVASATLEYHESWNQSAVLLDIWGLNDGVGDNWGETTITWNNAPGNDTNNNGGVLEAETVLLLGAQQQDDASGATHQVSNQALVDFLNSDTNGIVTFIFTRADTSGGTHQIGGRLDNPDPADWRPTLTVTEVPEPATLGLVGLGSLLMLARRRR